MTFQEFFIRKTPKFILLRFLLACVTVALLIPLIVRYISHEDLTVHTFFRYLFLSGFGAAVLTVMHLVSWWIATRSAKPKVYDQRPDA